MLCSLASKRAFCDINTCFSRSAPPRVTFDDITTVASGKDSVSIAMKEINDGTLGFVKILLTRQYV